MLGTINTELFKLAKEDNETIQLRALHNLQILWSELHGALRPLIAETIGRNLSELLDESNEDVQQMSRKLLSIMEEKTGEDLQHYLN